MHWQVDFTHSEIHFRVRHMMVGWARGEFERFSGTVNLDEENPENTTVEVAIEAASINTRQPDRDGHLRSPDFLDASHHPLITFTGKRVRQIGPTTAKLIGDLTIRGVTKEVRLNVEYAGTRRSPFGPYLVAGFSADTVISRREWGLTWNSLIEGGGVLVGDDVYINIELELIRTVEPQSAPAVAA